MHSALSESGTKDTPEVIKQNIENSANAILMLRSYFKAGRWEMLIQAAKIGELMELAA